VGRGHYLCYSDLETPRGSPWWHPTWPCWKARAPSSRGATEMGTPGPVGRCQCQCIPARRHWHRHWPWHWQQQWQQLRQQEGEPWAAVHRGVPRKGQEEGSHGGSGRGRGSGRGGAAYPPCTTAAPAWPTTPGGPPSEGFGFSSCGLRGAVSAGATWRPQGMPRGRAGPPRAPPLPPRATAPSPLPAPPGNPSLAWGLQTWGLTTGGRTTGTPPARPSGTGLQSTGGAGSGV